MSQISFHFRRALLFTLVLAYSASFAGDASEPEFVRLRPIDYYDAIGAMSSSSRYRQAATPVALLVMADGDGEEEASCSALLISSTLVLTARHCLEREDKLTGVIEKIYPSQLYILLDRFSTYGGKRVDLNITPVEIGKGKMADFMVLKTRWPISLEGRKIPPPGRDPVPLEDLYIIHFPYGRPLVITLKDCRATDDPIVDMNLKHRCATDPTSSGAPILNADFELIGIHIRGGQRSFGRHLQPRSFTFQNNDTEFDRQERIDGNPFNRTAGEYFRAR